MAGRLLLLITLLAVFAASCALPGTAKPPPAKWYWTESHAEELVLAKVRVPFCRVQPNFANDCRNGVRVGRKIDAYPVASADCDGGDELKQTFRYERFACSIEIRDYYGRPVAKGHIALHLTGASTFRWELL